MLIFERSPVPLHFVVLIIYDLRGSPHPPLLKLFLPSACFANIYLHLRRNIELINLPFRHASMQLTILALLSFHNDSVLADDIC